MRILGAGTLGHVVGTPRHGVGTGNLPLRRFRHGAGRFRHGVGNLPLRRLGLPEPVPWKPRVIRFTSRCHKY
jgi:hypothetical protein